MLLLWVFTCLCSMTYPIIWFYKRGILILRAPNGTLVVLYKIQFCHNKIIFVMTKKVNFFQKVFKYKLICIQNWLLLPDMEIKTQKSIVWDKIHFCQLCQLCLTKVNFVSQKSILSHKSQFCVTKVDFECRLVHRIQTKLVSYKFDFVRQNWQNWILSHKSQFCPYKIEFRVQNHKSSVRRPVHI